MHVYDKIIRLRVTLPFIHETTINTYLIADEIPTLIESGPGYQITTRELFPKLEKEGYRLTQIEQVVNTHEHPDHFGGNKEIYEVCSQVKFLAHPLAYQNFDQISYSPPKEAEKFLGEERVRLLEQYAGQFRKAKEIGVQRFLEEGETLKTGKYAFQIFHLPGHAPGHICLYEPDHKLLFSGDNVIGRGTPYVGGVLKEVKSLDGRLPPLGDMDEYLKSLQRLMELDIEMVIPAHGPTGRKERIQETYERKLAQLERAWEILKQEGPLTLRELTEKLYAHYAIAARLLEGSTSAYLKKLLKDERVRMEETEKGSLFYARG